MHIPARGRIPARPDPPDAAQPGAGEVGLPWGAQSRPSRGERLEARPGRRPEGKPRPGRSPAGAGMSAEPGKNLPAQPGQREAGAQRPSRGRDAPAQAGLGRDGPAGAWLTRPGRRRHTGPARELRSWGGECRPSRGGERRPSRGSPLFWPGLGYSGRGFFMPAR
jgi:hypothetical protein